MVNASRIENDFSHLVVTVATNANRTIILPTPIIGKKFRIYWSVDDDIYNAGVVNHDLNLQSPGNLYGNYMEYKMSNNPNQANFHALYSRNIAGVHIHNLNTGGGVGATIAGGIAGPLYRHFIKIKTGSYLDFICYSRNNWTISGKIISYD